MIGSLLSGKKTMKLFLKRILDDIINWIVKIADIKVPCSICESRSEYFKISKLIKQIAEDYSITDEEMIRQARTAAVLFFSTCNLSFEEAERFIASRATVSLSKTKKNKNLKEE